MMETTDCGTRPRKSRCNSSEGMYSSLVSTSYGNSSPLERDNVICRAELEVYTPYFCITFPDHTLSYSVKQAGLRLVSALVILFFYYNYFNYIFRYAMKSPFASLRRMCISIACEDISPLQLLFPDIARGLRFWPVIKNFFFPYRPLPAEFHFSCPALPAELHVLLFMSTEKSSAITFRVYDVL